MEIWRDVEGYEGLYQVSNLGRVKSLSRVFSKGTKILKPLKINSGYFIVNLWKNNRCTHKLIHRLVANEFIDNPHKKKCVNHIDGNKENNNINNLEWVTPSENLSHAITNNLFPHDHLEKMRKDKLASKKIGMYDKNMNLIKVFKNSIEAEKELKSQGIKAHSSNIRAVCTGINKSASGFIWRDL